MQRFEPKPAPGFAIPPYRAECLDGPKGGAGWWGVMNANGFNCLTYHDHTTGRTTGRTTTNQQDAEQIAQRWNDGSK